MRKKMLEKSFCDIDIEHLCQKKYKRSAFYKHMGDCRWRGVRNEPYKTESGEWTNIIRKVLIGSHGETTKFHLRYFEISPGGYSSLEKHRHEHVVICVKGKGVARTDNIKREMKYMDTLYISPDTPHQLLNPYKEPFGFLCIVNAKRDRPKLLKG
ncbi:MAG: cupin domain-containing protein [Nitrospirota bacterium]